MTINNTRRRRISYSPTRRRKTSSRSSTPRRKKIRSHSPTTRRKRRSSPLVLPSSWGSSLAQSPQSKEVYRGKIKKEWPKPISVTPKNIASLFGWKTVFPEGTVLIVDYKKGPNPFQNVPGINNLPRDNSTMKIKVIEMSSWNKSATSIVWTIKAVVLKGPKSIEEGSVQTFNYPRDNFYLYKTFFSKNTPLAEPLNITPKVSLAHHYATFQPNRTTMPNIPEAVWRFSKI
jgi:hypothetical protein